MSITIAPEQFDIEWFKSIKVQKRSVGNPSTNKKIYYKDIITAFDIETTRIKAIEQAVMYIWQWQFGHEYTVIGRTWQEFVKFSELIASTMGENEYLCTFVHNLSYEFQFLKGVYKFEQHEVFAIDRRKVLKCNLFNHIEMRCSYIHSNMGLSEYTHKMGAEHAKLSGIVFNYKVMRFHWTELSENELKYVINDVLGLVEAIEIEMKHDGDTLYSFPLTSTGYVRRDAKKAMKTISHTYVRNQLPDYKIYQFCREAFRGGNTHANRYYAGFILNNVKSADRSSSYPEVLCNLEFPVSSFYHVGSIDYKELLDLINVRKKAVLMRVSMTNVRLRDKFWGAPYLSRDKCRNIRGAVYDNGRILEAEYLETTITDVDFKIILGEYDFDDFAPFDVAHARYGKLPKPLIQTIIKYYEAKTSLKDVEGQEVYYMKSKNKINAIYGMMAQDPIKQSIDFINDEFEKHCDNPQELLIASNKKAFLCYQWGVWTTAHSRAELEEGIKLAGDGFRYCDTDSVKYQGDVDWSGYNESKIKASKKNGAYAIDKNGKVHYMGVFEQESDAYEFSTLGAKKYCYRKTKDSELIITIAGVTKSKGGKELEKAGGISAFKAGFIFGREGGCADGEIIEEGAGGLDAVYNDKPEITEYEIDGRKVTITSNVVLKDGVYSLGITSEYERLLEISHKYVDI